jgi:hypothetical protein
MTRSQAEGLEQQRRRIITSSPPETKSSPQLKRFFWSALVSMAVLPVSSPRGQTSSPPPVSLTTRCLASDDNLDKLGGILLLQELIDCLRCSCGSAVPPTAATAAGSSSQRFETVPFHEIAREASKAGQKIISSCPFLLPLFLLLDLIDATPQSEIARLLSTAAMATAATLILDELRGVFSPRWLCHSNFGHFWIGVLWC